MSITAVIACPRFLIRCLLGIPLLFLPLVMADKCLGQLVPPQNEQQTPAKQALNRGVEAFKNGQYNEAEQDFQRAKELDPHLLNARLYLATAYASQYIPGAPAEENVAMGRKALEEFKGALALDAHCLPAIDGAGSISFQMAGQPFDPKMFAESKSYFADHIQLSPQDPEPYYWIGVIDWTLSYRANGELRARYNQTALGTGLQDSEPLPSDLLAEYAREYGPIIEDGIEKMCEALELNPEYDDAMAYLNLLYRRKADTVDSETERVNLIKMADDLMDKIKEVKQKRAEADAGPQSQPR